MQSVATALDRLGELAASPTVATLAAAEGLHAHAASIEVRVK